MAGPKEYITVTDSRIPQMRSYMSECFVNYEQPRDCKFLLLVTRVLQRHGPGKQVVVWFERTS